MMSSCTILKSRNNAPDYVNDTLKREAMITHEPIPLGVDSNKVIVVYNVVEKEEKKLKISDETIRLLIADFFGTIGTIITVWQLQENP